MNILYKLQVQVPGFARPRRGDRPYEEQELVRDATGGHE